MKRRQFLGLTGLAAASLAMPTVLTAGDIRKELPKAWTATKVDVALMEVFGKSTYAKKGMKIKAPDIAENGAVIPVTFSSKEKIKRVALFQDANPESTVVVMDIQEGMIVDYSFRIKMAKTGEVIAVAETESGELIGNSKIVKVTAGGCGG